MSDGREISKVTRGAATVGIATALSRITGFLRDVAIANFFGAAGATDAFFVAFRIPNMFRRLLGEGRGSLTSAFVPIFSESLEREGPDESRRFFATTAGWLLLALAVVVALGVAFSPALISVFSPGFKTEPEKFRLAVLLNRVMFPYLLFISAVALLMGVLNSLGHFLAPAIAPVLLNASLIAAAFVSPNLKVPVLALAVAVVVAGVLQLTLQLPPLASRRFLVAPRLGGLTEQHRRLLKLMVPATLGFVVYSVNILITPAIGSMLAEGAISYLYYADRLVQLPLAIIGISFATALLPSLSRSAARADMDEFRETLSASIHKIAFLSIPAAAGLFVLAGPIVQVLFERGKFTPDATAATADALAAYAVGLLAFSVAQVLLRAFYAQKDLWTPLASELIAALSFLLLSVALVGPLQNPPVALIGKIFDNFHIFSLGHAGIALAFSLAAYIQVLFLALRLGRRMGGAGIRRLAVPILKILAAAILMGALLDLALNFFTFFEFAYKISIWKRGGMLLALICAGAVAYGGAALLLGEEEAARAWSALSARLGRWTRNRRGG